ncbi:efflux RND transporter periplasmic adaptor subunit [Conexibacter sp. SYSU D00693]|uniref:efflux RND transporter periplasmic adaptor subunit n=1 Tax=Conexibacter sp. SYSU D00693 TaxID=2812560 RepID=UPI00196A7778|nr:efflux RND transporter periplasmic adaptor subunit [Conexibacter sp. SYSU D00693]
MTRGRWALTGAATLVVAGAGVAGVAASGGGQTPRAGEPGPVATATVQRGRLSETVSRPGTLTYTARSDGAPYRVRNRASGTFTRLPRLGARVRCGDVLYRVDEEPVLLLCGAVPVFRDLREGDEGRDVLQLNRNLQRLGLGTDRHERRFTWRTLAALERLQHRRGMEETGELADDDAVVLPAAARVAKVTAQAGDPARAGAEVVQATSATLGVRLELDPAQRGSLRTGDRARVTLPGGRSATGRVVRVGRVAQAPDEEDAGSGGAATIPVTVRLDDAGAAGGLDRAPVQVEVRTRGVRDVLSVPVTALVGRTGGGFAVEVVGAGGRRALVAVRVGLFDAAQGRVQVQGGVRAGDRVVVPAS